MTESAKRGQPAWQTTSMRELSSSIHPSTQPVSSPSSQEKPAHLQSSGPGMMGSFTPISSFSTQSSSGNSPKLQPTLPSGRNSPSLTPVRSSSRTGFRATEIDSENWVIPGKRPQSFKSPSLRAKHGDRNRGSNAQSLRGRGHLTESQRRRQQRGPVNATAVLRSIPLPSSQPRPSTDVRTYRSHRKPSKDVTAICAHPSQDIDRRISQHYILRAAFGSDFTAPMRQALEMGSVILDVNCGPGAWTMEMSSTFKQSIFLGIHRSQVYPRDIKPKNCHFRTYDFRQLPLPFPDESIDFIFQRDVNLDLDKDQWKPLVKEYMRVLKPGGWLELVEQDLETKSGGKLECELNDQLVACLSKHNQDPHIVNDLPSILSSSGYRRVENKFQSLPLGWLPTEGATILDPQKAFTSTGMFARSIASQQVLHLQALQSWLSRSARISSSKFSSYLANLPVDWVETGCYINWHAAIGQKPWDESTE